MVLIRDMKEDLKDEIFKKKILLERRAKEKEMEISRTKNFF